MILKSLPSSVEPLLRQVQMGLAMIGIGQVNFGLNSETGASKIQQEVAFV